MYKIHLYSSIILFLLLTACKSTKPMAFPMVWQSAPVTTDAVASEWKLPLKYYGSAGKVGYTFSNDDTCLYVCIRSADQAMQMKMIRAGMVLSIDTSGGTKGQFSVSYPVPKDGAKGSDSDLEELTPGMDQSPGLIAAKQRLLAEQVHMDLYGFAQMAPGASLLRNASGLSVSMKMDMSGTLTYEASIPFKLFYKKRIETSDTARVLGFSILIQGISMAPLGDKGNKALGSTHAIGSSSKTPGRAVLTDASLYTVRLRPSKKDQD